jgi:hypothetical protein
MTGCIPLLLRSLSAFGNGDFDEAEFLRSKELELVNRHIVEFYTELLATITLEARRQQ